MGSVQSHGLRMRISHGPIHDLQTFNPSELPGVVRDERYAEAQGVRSDLRIQ